jgi:two-component system, cell cycle sensor histidine kinase and response regulator CckA
MRARDISILVVEDERIVARDLQLTLRSFEYDAFAIASSAEEAIAAASTRLPDLVLMDIGIKGKLDGIETAALMTERFGVPVVYLTAHSDEVTRARARFTAPYGYLLKPVKPAELRNAIEMSIYRHEMELRLRERERLVSTTLSSIADPVISVDLGGRIAFVNPAAESLLGCVSAQAIGRPASEVLRTVDDREIAIDTALREERIVEEIDTVFGASGGIRVLESAAPVQDGKSKLGAVMVFRDASKAQKHQVVDQLASLGMMSAGIAHEVNSPLAVISANAAYVLHELVQIVGKHRYVMGGDATRLDESIVALRELEQSATRISQITADLRDFARPPALPIGLVDVRRIVDRAIRSTLPELKERALLETRLDPVPAARANGAQLGRVVVNLIVNAANAIEPGRPADNRVVVSTRTDGKRTFIEVRDTGRGMAPDVAARVFEPFYTANGGRGAGLGLSIARGIVASMGGEIQFETQPGVGSVFRVALPVPQEVSEELLAGRRARVLCIDDDPDVLAAVPRMLHDHMVVCVDSAEQATKVLQDDDPFDVIIADLVMSKMRGVDVYDWLVTVRPDDACRVVFTGSLMDARIDAFLRSVPNHFIEKPFRGDDLVSLVQRLSVTR